MPKRKITPELWEAVSAAYDQWTGDKPIDEVLRPYGISKQAFYAERRRVGLEPKTARPNATSTEDGTIKVLLDALVEARLKIRQLEMELHGRR